MLKVEVRGRFEKCLATVICARYRDEIEDSLHGYITFYDQHDKVVARFYAEHVAGYTVKEIR